MAIQLKRIYDRADSADGHRILTDGIWPRGISKEKAGIDEWAKDVAPSNELRKWFGHDPEKFQQFKQAYKKELQEDEDKKGRLQN